MSDKLINGATEDHAAPAAEPAANPRAAPAPSAPQVPHPLPPPAETINVDGIRLRVIHYCDENGIAFNLYKTKPDGTRIAEVPLSTV